jgi:hypothetical protein
LQTLQKRPAGNSGRQGYETLYQEQATGNVSDSLSDERSTAHGRVQDVVIGRTSTGLNTAVEITAGLK